MSECFPTLLNEASITLIPKPDKNITEEKSQKVSLMNIAEKILSKIIKNQIKQKIRIIRDDQVEFIPEM